MAFWDLTSVPLEWFRPGIFSKVEIGNNLIMVCMEIGPGREDAGHVHPFDQSGVVLEGRIEMFVGGDCRLLRPNQSYFIPAGERHGWRTLNEEVRLLDVSPKNRLR